MARWQRALGTTRLRTAAPWLIGGALLATGALAAGLARDALGFNPGLLMQAAAVAAAWLIYRGLRRLALSAAERRERDPRPPVLLLREFGDDALAMGRFSVTPRLTFERVVTGELERLGPPISIGRPGERLPPLGAARDYLDDPDWKRAVGDRIRDAGAVVFILGASESLGWEYRAAASLGARERSLVVVPPLRDAAALRERWARFADLEPAAGRFPDDAIAFFFAGLDPVVLRTPRRDRRAYQVVLRLYGWLAGCRPASGGAVESLLRERLPLVAFSHD